MTGQPIPFSWLKRLMPRGLYGRAALILILPIVTIQLVVSITFIQRHFEGVTRQMTVIVANQIDLLREAIEKAPDAAAAQEAAQVLGTPLGMRVVLPAVVPIADRRVFYDLSGRAMISTLRELVPGVEAIDLWDLRRVRILMMTPKGPAEVSFDRKQVTASNPHQLLVLMVGTSLLMTVIAFLFLRNQLRPIRRLAKAAEAFGRGRSEAYRPAGALEVRSAGNAFLDMRNRIERQIEQRTLLLSGVSHDLRTPLTRLRLGLAMLDETDETAALQRDVDEMQRMLDAFLEFARGTAEGAPSQDVDPAQLLADIVADHRRMGHHVTIHAVEGQGTIRLDPDALRRALNNLIGNALRYGTVADITLTVLERSVRFAVEDDGPGIPKDRRDEAMRPFTRLDDARNQNRGGGVGLGLAITADIARSRGGSLRLGDSARLGGLKAELVMAR